ncbi:MAG: hypothetical protein KC777_10125 [Cyanobacteria bacterium HKST-UBA02]|nr:hypothetical protein [Cyanobacteria bacterium HKST-UBA02]
MPGLGATGGKFQLSAGWRYASADRSYFNSRYNKQFTQLWGPKERLSVLDVTALYRINNRMRVTCVVPIPMNKFSMIFPPLGIDQGSRHGWSVSGIGDVSLYAQSFLFDPKDHPFENISLGVGIKTPSGNWNAQRFIPNELGFDLRRRAAYPPAMQPGDGGTGMLFGYDAYKVMRSPQILRGTTLFSSGLYLANPRGTNGTPSIIQNLGVPLSPAFASRTTNSVADTWTLEAGFSSKIPRTWEHPLLSKIRVRGTFNWSGLRSRDIFGNNRGFRQPGWAMAFAPGFTFQHKQHMLIVEVPIIFGRHINPGATALPGAPTVRPDGSIAPGGINPNRQMGLVAPSSISVRYVRTL